MGLFSSKYVTQVGTSVSRVITNERIPNAVTAGSVKALIQSTDLVDEIMEELIGSIAVRAGQMYNYAKNTYTYGLPSGSFKTAATDGLLEATDVLTALEGAPVTLEYSYLTEANLLHMGWTQLIALHGYVQSTNEIVGLTAQIGHKVYLEDLVVVIPASTLTERTEGELAQWGIAATAGWTPARNYSEQRAMSPYISSAVAVTEHILVNYIWNVGTDIFRDSFNLELPDFNSEVDYFHVKYKVGNTFKYWMYEDNLGTYPELDAVYNTPPVSGTFFPFVYFRYNKTPEAVNTPGHLTSKRLVKYLGLDYDNLVTSINENPDIGDVEQAMLTMAVPANSSNPIELEYGSEEYTESYGGSIEEKEVTTDSYYYRQQITANQCIEIRVKDLEMVYHIYGGYNVTADETDNILLVPLDHSITETFSIMDREELYARSLHFVFNSRVVTKVKWYQQQWFADFLMIVAIIILFYTGVDTTGAVGSYLAAAGLTGTALIIGVFIVNAIIGMAIGYVLKIIIKEIGIELAFLIALIVALYYGPKALQAMGMPGVTTAEQLLWMATGIMSAQSAIIADDMKGLAAEQEALDLLITESDRKIEAANKLLENNNRLSPFIIFGETPNDYYNRTIHSGNIGVLSLGIPAAFVTIALKLPDINETIGEYNYA